MIVVMIDAQIVVVIVVNEFMCGVMRALGGMRSAGYRRRRSAAVVEALLVFTPPACAARRSWLEHQSARHTVGVMWIPGGWISGLSRECIGRRNRCLAGTLIADDLWSCRRTCRSCASRRSTHTLVTVLSPFASAAALALGKGAVRIVRSRNGCCVLAGRYIRVERACRNLVRRRIIVRAFYSLQPKSKRRKPPRRAFGDLVRWHVSADVGWLYGRQRKLECGLHRPWLRYI